jgi:hypothetical protein
LMTFGSRIGKSVRAARFKTAIKNEKMVHLR